MEAAKKSKVQAKIEGTIQRLTVKSKTEILTRQEVRILANAELKLEAKSASKVYKTLEQMDELRKSQLLGNAKFPAFKEFVTLLPENRTLFSTWDGLGVLTKLNKSAVIASKVKRQGGKVTKKVAVTAKGKKVNSKLLVA